MSEQRSNAITAYRAAVIAARRAWISAHGAARAAARRALHDAIVFLRIERLTAPL